MRRSALALAVACFSALASSVQAQIPASRDTIQGIELAAGQKVGIYRVGATFAATATGAVPGAMTVTIKYTPNSPGVGVTNTVVSGQWALLVYQNRQLLGSLSGTVTSGSAVWNTTGTTTTVANVSITLKILGGTGRYAGKSGTGSFTGTLSHLTFPPTITGTLGLSF
jgi:hypothetical protein